MAISAWRHSQRHSNEGVFVSSCELEQGLLSAATATGPIPTNPSPPFFHNLTARSDRITSRRKHRTASQMHSDFDEILENNPSHFEVPISYPSQLSTTGSTVHILFAFPRPTRLHNIIQTHAFINGSIDPCHSHIPIHPYTHASTLVNVSPT